MPLDRRRFLTLAAGFAVGGPALAKSRSGTARLLHGPMLGAPEPDAIRVWVRGSEPLECSVEASQWFDFSREVIRGSAVLEARDEHAGVVTVRGLKPDTSYFYRIRVNGVPDPYLPERAPFEACTAPRIGAERALRIAFGSCARHALDSEQPIWNAVRKVRPDLFLWLGDNVYGDTLVSRTLNEEYARQRAVPSFQPVGARVPQLAIWDDHDYGLNNHDRSHPAKQEALRLFRSWWANPGYGQADAPGVYFVQRFGAVDLFMLDGRWYRDANDAPDGEGKTLLGNAQLEWLMRGLEASTARFKLLVCGSGWSSAKGPRGDSWSAFLHERERLFKFIFQRGIQGVVLLSGDTHSGELNAIPGAGHGGYDLYDLVSSPLAQEPRHSWMVRTPEARLRRPYSQTPNFGLLDIRFEPEPRLRFNVVSVEGREVWAPLELRAAELRNGVESWKAKKSVA